MNWAPPRLLDAPPTNPAETPATTNTSAPGVAPETEAERRGLSAVPAAAWIALLGSTLLLGSAIAVVAASWGTIGEGVRVAALAVATMGLLLAAERLRVVVPTTARIIAHVATLLIASVAIAVLSLLGVTWPGCLLASGIALIAATELQANRWGRTTMHFAQLTGWAMTSTGTAALLSTTAGLVAMISSIGLLVAGAHRRSAILAILAVLSPAMTALADAGIGSGTLHRAGLVGERLGWSGPAVGLIAATLIGTIARRRSNNPLMIVAAASPVIGIVTGLAATDSSSIAWWSVPALVVAAAELCLWMLPADRFRKQIGELVDVIAVTVAGGLWFAPAIASFEPADTELMFPWAVPITLTGLAVSLSLRRWRSAESVFADLGIAAVAAGSIGLAAAFDAPGVLVATVAVAATGMAALGSRRRSPFAIHPTAIWAVVSVASLADGNHSPRTIIGLTLLATCLAIVVAARARSAAAARVPGWFEMVGVVALGAGGAVALVDGAAPAVGLTAAAIVVFAVVLADRRFTWWGVATYSISAIIALDSATASGHLDRTYWAGLATGATVFVGIWLVQRSTATAVASACTAVLTFAAFGAGVDLPPPDAVVMAMLSVTALTGVAFAIGRRPALDAAAVTAGVVLLGTTSLPVAAELLSAAWVVIGLQVLVAGVSLQNLVVRRIGIVVSGSAVASWWFTSGLKSWLIEMLEPVDVGADDIWLAIASIGALTAGLALRASFGVNSWVAYSAALLVPGLWLTSAHVDRGPVWAAPTLLAVGVAAAVLGAWHRLAAPLVGGTVLAVTAMFLATGSDLSAVPTWTWLAIGGAVLLATAVLIERGGRDGSSDLRELIARWQ